MRDQPHCLAVVYKSAELGWPTHSSFQRETPFSQGLCRQSQALDIATAGGSTGPWGGDAKELASPGTSASRLSLTVSLYLGAPDFLPAARQLPFLILRWELEDLPQTQDHGVSLLYFLVEGHFPDHGCQT